MKKVRSSHSYIELSKTQFFPVSIALSLEGSQLDFKKQYLLKMCSTKLGKVTGNTYTRVPSQPQ